MLTYGRSSYKAHHHKLLNPKPVIISPLYNGCIPYTLQHVSNKKAVRSLIGTILTVCAWKSSRAGIAKSVAKLSPSRLRFKDASTAKESPLDRVRLVLEVELMNLPPCAVGVKRGKRQGRQRIYRKL
jgi:hypothetical protein